MRGHVQVSSLRRLHRVAGLVTLAAFLLSGAYMRLIAHPGELPAGEHLMFVSRHIYMLASALVHLALSAYIGPRPTRAGRATQWLASSLLAASSLLLIGAFVAGPVAGRERTLVSSLGIYALAAGAVLHFALSLRRS